jgi:hypothetical protein
MQCHENEPQKTRTSCADPAGNEVQDTLQKDENRVTSPSIQDLIGFTLMPLKRSKRRENLVDENTSERAERLKAIRIWTALVRPNANPLYPIQIHV